MMKRRLSQWAIHVLVFSIPFLIGLGAAIWVVDAMTEPPQTRPYDVGVIRPPAIKPSLPTAVILVGQEGIKSTDLLAPYGILASSGAMNVLTVAPQRVLSPVSFGVDLLPHFSFQGLDSLLGRKPDLVVVPSLASPVSTEIREWVRSQVSDSTSLVVLSRDALDEGFPDISSSGTTASMDALFRAVVAIAGEQVAQATADRLRYRRPMNMDPVDPLELGLADYAALYLMAGFVWDKRNVGVTLFDGVSEVDLGAVFDVYPRVFDADVESVGLTRRVFTTMHGLHLVPRLGLDEDPKIHELAVPGVPGDSDLDAIRAWAAQEEVPAFNPFGGPSSDKFAYDASLDGVAGARGAAVALAVAKRLHYPANRLSMDTAPAWPYDVMLVAFAFGLLALFIFRIAVKRRIPANSK